jgi:hypothetical protein
LVVTAVFVSLVAMVHATSRYQFQSQRRETAKVATQTDLRIWLDRVVHDLQNAAYDPRETNLTSPTFTIVALSSSPAEIRFTTDYDRDGVLDSDPRENRGFRLNGDVLELWQGGSAWRPLLRRVTNLTFTCIDAQAQEFPCATASKRSLAAMGVTITARGETAGVSTMAAPSISQKAMVEFRNEIR